MAPTILIPLAPGFEEIEAVTLIDVLRRAELHVVVASLGEELVLGSRGVSILADVNLAQVDLDSVDVLCLPGGMGGTLALRDDERILGLVRRLCESGQLVAAICAAPMVLEAAGVTEGRAITAHPGVGDQLGTDDVRPGERVVRSGSLLTSQGPGTTMEFALAIVADLCGLEVAQGIATALVAGADCRPH